LTIRRSRLAARRRAIFLVEEFIPGAEVALEGLLAGGRLRVLALFDKPDPLDGPFFEETIYVTPSRLPAAVQQAIADTTQAAATALGLTEGPVHAELRYNERGPWLIELAARPIGGRCSAALASKLGTDVRPLASSCPSRRSSYVTPWGWTCRRYSASASRLV
jgi:biotin carboxylase